MRKIMQVLSKKLGPGKRKTGRTGYPISFDYNAAQRLMDNQFGVTYSNPEPERAGEKRAEERLRKKREANEKIPKNPGVSRQVARAMNRRMLKRMGA